MSQQEQGGFHTSCQLFFFFLLYFYDQLSPRLPQNVMTAAFSAFVFVCILLQFYTKGYPDSCSPSGDNCVWRWKGRARELEKKPEQTWLGLGSFPSLRTTLPVRAQEPEAAVSHSEGFHSCTGPELCVIQKLSKTMAIPLTKISFSVSVLLSITVVCRNTAAGNPREAKKKRLGHVKLG